MGVSFKISKVGSRFKPKPVVSEANGENSVESSQPKAKKDESITLPAITSATKLDGRDEDAAGFSGPLLSCGRHLISSEDEVSFVLNLYLDGYSVGKPSEAENLHNVNQDGAKLLHPYDRTSESLFAAIESGRLPGDILEDMPCKYVNGQIICEVRDYRRCILDSESNIASPDATPTVTKVHLKMSLENVVKDIPLIADDSWTYGDLMEVESRILKALQPKLCLDPTPRLDRLSDSSLSSKLDLGLNGLRKRRLRQITEVMVTSHNKPHGKKVCIGPFSESSGLGESGAVSADIMSQHAHTQVCPNNTLPTRSRGFVHDNSLQAINVASPESKFQLGSGDQRIMPDSIPGSALNTSGASPAVHDMTTVHMDNMNSINLPHAKMEGEEGPVSSLNKKVRHFGPECTLPQQMGPYMDSLQASDIQWKNPLHQQQGHVRGMHFSNPGIQKYAQLMRDGAPSQEGMASVPIRPLGMNYGVPGERFETEKIGTPGVKRPKSVMQTFDAENNHMDSRILQRLPTQNAFMRPGLNQGVWNNIGQADKDPRKEDLIQKRILVQSPRNSVGSGVQFPLSAKSTELSCGSLVNQYGTVSSAAAQGSSQREKPGGPSIPVAGRTPSVNSSANDSVQQQHQSHVSAKRRSNSLPKTQAMSGVGSPASVSNANVSMNAASPSVSTPSLADQAILERFSKIEMVNMRHQLNSKKSRSDDFPRNSTFSHQQLRVCLSDSTNNESIKDESCTMPLSKSLVGGNINLPKIRVLTLTQAERTLQGNSVPVPPRAKTRMIMSEKPSDGTVAMHYGDLDEVNYLNAEDHLPSLPNTHFADLLAAEFYRLIVREGYYVEDHVQYRPPSINISPSTQPSGSGVAPSIPTIEMQQHSEAVPPQTNEGAKPFSGNTSVNTSPSYLPSVGMLRPPGSSQALQMSQGLLPGVSMPARSQQLDPQQIHQQQQSSLLNQPSLIQPQQQQQQQSQFQRSLMMPPNSLSPIQNSNLQLGNQMMNKPSLQVLQQQQQPQMQQRKMMMGPAMGMGNMANNMAGPLSIGGARGIGATGISAPVVPIPGISNMGQNAMGMNQASNFSNAISQHIRSGTLTQAQAAIFSSRMRMVQNRGMLGGPLSSVADTRQMQPGSTAHSILGQTLNRGNMSPMQHTPLGQRAAPKLMSGMNVHVTPQQQQQMQLQQQQQMQLQQQQQLQQLQQLPPPITQLQQETSSLQAVVSPPQVSSPSTLGIPQSYSQQPIPQQQQASSQISSGAMHPMTAANPEAGAASPQVSSVTLGSGGSIANSSMDLQGMNKSSSMGNT